MFKRNRKSKNVHHPNYLYSRLHMFVNVLKNSMKPAPTDKLYKSFPLLFIFFFYHLKVKMITHYGDSIKLIRLGGKGKSENRFYFFAKIQITFS